MPEPQTTQTTGAGAGGAPAIVDVDAGDALAAALAMLPADGPADDAGDEPDHDPALDADEVAAGGDKPEKKKPEDTAEAKDDEADEGKEKKKKRKTRAELEAFLLSPEQTATPEGRERAREYLRDRSGWLDGYQIRLDKKGANLAREREEFDAYRNAEEARLETDRAYARKLAGLARKLDDPENMAELVNAIGTITNRDGREIWERWTKFALAGGKRAEATAGEQRALERVASLEQQVMRLVEELRNGGQEQQAEAAERELADLGPRVERLQSEIIAAAGNVEQYPHLAPYTGLQSWHPQIIADYRRIKQEARARGEKLDRAGVLARLNGELAKLAKAGATPASPAGAKPAKPVTEKVTSISPSQSRAGGAIREMTQEEREAALAADTEYLGGLFGTG